MPEDFNPEEFPLVSVHVRTVGGTIYVCLADDPPDFAPYQEALTQQLAPHALEHAKVAFEADLVEYGNWKMVMENSRECYHCATGHDELMRTFLDIYDCANPDQATSIRSYWDKWETRGFRAERQRGANPPGRPPAVHRRCPVHRPWTASSRSAVHSARRRRMLIGSLRWVHYPSTFNHCAERLRSAGADASARRRRRRWSTTKWLVDADAVEGRDYDLEQLLKVWTITNDQDKALVERNQAGVRSGGYRPGPYSPSLEAGVLKFVDWYCEKLDHHLDGLSRSPNRDGRSS